MENNELHSFTFVPTFLTDLMSLPYETRCKVVDAICYWGVYKELPPEVDNDPVISALLMNPQRMIEGQDKYRGQKSDEGKKKKTRAVYSDEQIKGAIIELYKKTGVSPSEKSVIEYCGGGVQRIGGRPIWKKKDEIIREYLLYESNLTNVSNDSYNLTNVSYKVCNDEKKGSADRVFDF